MRQGKIIRNAQKMTIRNNLNRIERIKKTKRLTKEKKAGKWLRYTGPDPEHSNTGVIECRRHDVSSISCKGGEYERGSRPFI